MINAVLLKAAVEDAKRERNAPAKPFTKADLEHTIESLREWHKRSRLALLIPHIKLNRTIENLKAWHKRNYPSLYP